MDSAFSSLTLGRYASSIGARRIIACVGKGQRFEVAKHGVLATFQLLGGD